MEDKQPLKRVRTEIIGNNADVEDIIISVKNQIENVEDNRSHVIRVIGETSASNLIDVFDRQFLQNLFVKSCYVSAFC